MTDAERKTLAEVGKKRGKQALEEIASIVKIRKGNFYAIPVKRPRCGPPR